MGSMLSYLYSVVVNVSTVILADLAFFLMCLKIHIDLIIIIYCYYYMGNLTR